MPVNTLSNKSENYDSGSQWDTLRTTANAGTLMEEFGDRIIYTDENGKETRMTLNPWAMASNVLRSPEDMLLTGQAFEHIAEKWADDDRNPERKVKADEAGHTVETGWDEAIRPSTDSMLGRWVKKNMGPGNSHSKTEQMMPAGTLLEEFGDRIIYTDENGRETRMTLNPWSMMDDALESPDNMSLAGAAFRNMATRWHNGEKNPDRKVRTNADGETIETGWENARRVDSGEKLGQYIGEKLKKLES